MIELGSALGQGLVDGGVECFASREAAGGEVVVLDVAPQGFIAPNLMHGCSVARRKGNCSIAAGSLPGGTLSPVDGHVTIPTRAGSAHGSWYRVSLLWGLVLGGGVRRSFGCQRATDQFSPGWELLADVETTGALAVVQVEAVPVRPVARAVWRAAPAAGLAAANVLLAVAHASGAAG